MPCLQADRYGEVSAACRAQVPVCTLGLPSKEQPEPQHDWSKLQRHLKLHAVAASAATGWTLVELESFGFAEMGISLRASSRDGLGVEPLGC